MKVTVTLADGTKQEVEHTALQLPAGASLLEPGKSPEGYISKAAAEAARNQAIEAAIKERFPDHVSRTEAAKDSAIIASVLKEHGEGDFDLESHNAKIRAEEVTPLTERIKSLNEAILKTAIKGAAAAVGFDEKFLTSPNGQPSYAETLLASHADLDPETGVVYYTEPDEDGKPQRVPGPSGTPQLTLSSAVDRLRQVESYKPYLAENPTQTGAGLNTSSNNADSGKTMSRSQFESMDDPAEQQKFMDEGGTLTE